MLDVLLGAGPNHENGSSQKTPNCQETNASCRLGASPPGSARVPRILHDTVLLHGAEWHNYTAEFMLSRANGSTLISLSKILGEAA